MPSAAQVRPAKWSDIAVLFDDGQYSVISGTYDQGDHVLGERWNGEGDDLGFPNVAGYPVWHVVPEWLRIPVLHALLDELASDPPNAREAEYRDAILGELRRLRNT